MEEKSNNEAAGRKWLVDKIDEVREADVETLAQWIIEGRVLKHHKVSREGVRWLEAGKVPGLAGYFLRAKGIDSASGKKVLDSNMPVRVNGSFGAPIKTFLVIVMLSLAGSFMWTHYREKAEESELSFPGAPPVRSTTEKLADYQAEKRSLIELNKANEIEISQMVAAPGARIVGNMEMCYQPKYSRDLPTGHPEMKGYPRVEIGKVLNEECAANLKKKQEEADLIHNVDFKQKQGDKQMKQQAFAAQITALDEKIGALQKREEAGILGVALEARFYWAFASLLIGLAVLNFLRLILKKKIAEPLLPA